MFFEGYGVLVTGPQECLLNWANLWKHLWKHLLFLFPFPWHLSNISSGQNSMSNLQVYNVHKYFCCCPHSSESFIPWKKPRLMQTTILPCKIRCQMILATILLLLSCQSLFLCCNPWNWQSLFTNCIFYLTLHELFKIILKIPKTGLNLSFFIVFLFYFNLLNNLLIHICKALRTFKSHQHLCLIHNNNGVLFFCFHFLLKSIQHKIMYWCMWKQKGSDYSIKFTNTFIVED